LAKNPIFLILQLDSPFDGIMHISSRPIANALAHMPKPDATAK